MSEGFSKAETEPTPQPANTKDDQDKWDSAVQDLIHQATATINESLPDKYFPIVTLEDSTNKHHLRFLISIVEHTNEPMDYWWIIGSCRVITSLTNPEDSSEKDSAYMDFIVRVDDLITAISKFTYAEGLHDMQRRNK